MGNKWAWCILCFLFFVVLMGCAPGTERYPSSEEPATFLHGIWHGWIAPVSLIWGIFNNSIRVYEVNNTGWWYDLGFYMAVISGFGSLSLARKSKNKKCERDC